jgi:hypothetical protein
MTMDQKACCHLNRERKKIPKGADYKDQWERVICPTIHTKYVTRRCNLNNEIQKTYKSKCKQMRTIFFNINNNDLKLILSRNR